MSDERREGYVYLNQGPPIALYSQVHGYPEQAIPATLIIHHPAKEYVGNAGRVFKKNERGEVVTRARDVAAWELVWAWDGVYRAYVGAQEPANLRALADCMEDR